MAGVCLTHASPAFSDTVIHLAVWTWYRISSTKIFHNGEMWSFHNDKNPIYQEDVTILNLY